MNEISELIIRLAGEAVASLYGTRLAGGELQVTQTRKEFEGDFTLVVFPLLKISKQSPEATAIAIGDYLQTNASEIARFNVVKGFLNMVIADHVWLHFLSETAFDARYGTQTPDAGHISMKMIEYSSPNTNKPLHLGHIRNNLLGYSVSKIMEAAGNKVVKVNLVNDRGIHICKSMLAWQKWGHGETPESSGQKGDHLVGDYYVRFDVEYKKEIEQLVQQGMDKDEAARKAPSIIEAQEMLRRWEAKDPETIALWEKMNGWVYAGFDVTYQRLGVSFDRIYHESQTYLLGKEIVVEGLKRGVFFRKDDGSVWIDLTADGLDEKLLLRSDGTSVYITQDIGTACKRFEEYAINELVYVVGNEQNYHFQVLSLILSKLGYEWAKTLKHLSYGMVELPKGMGKMKSREGTVVDADELMDEMITTARDMSQELGKLDELTPEEAEKIVKIIGLGALKYFILKVDPQKNMVFNPKESIDFNGNTGPFIQYTHARICSVLRKAGENGVLTAQSAIDTDISLTGKEVALVHSLYNYPAVVADAAETYSPALIANYVYDLAKEYNQFYHDYSILKEENKAIRLFRVLLSQYTAQVIRNALELLGIEAPERM
ncbi:MAG: arginine--tRNA ligase [Bacteroidales bacterium]|jgi:arginyl-tRNA synthetase|nr:arginine--tRNA ligase [Bacteroidales bacterium]